MRHRLVQPASARALSRRDIRPHRPRPLHGRAMPAQCRWRGQAARQFQPMDAARPTTTGPSISSPRAWRCIGLPILRRPDMFRALLAPNGMLIYAASRQELPRMADVLAAEGLPVGLLGIPELPGIVDEERIVADDDTLGFLRRMKRSAGSLPAKAMRQCRRRPSPRHPRRRREAWRSHHLAHRLWPRRREPVQSLDQPGIGAGNLPSVMQ